MLIKKLYISEQGIILGDKINEVNDEVKELATKDDVDFYLCAGGILEGKYIIEGGIVEVVEDEEIGWDVRFEEDKR